MLIILLVLLFGLSILYYIRQSYEYFCPLISQVDPTSIFLHEDISRKEDWWEMTHAKKLYDYHDMPDYSIMDI